VSSNTLPMIMPAALLGKTISMMSAQFVLHSADAGAVALALLSNCNFRECNADSCCQVGSNCLRYTA